MQHYIAYCNDCNKCQYVNTDNIPEEECLEHNYVVDLYRCPKCMFTGKNYTGLKIHMNAKHKEATKYISCSICVRIEKSGLPGRS